MVAEPEPRKSHLEQVADEIAALEDEQGRVTPEAVLERARDPQSAMHSAITWNVEVAAFEHQLDQARTLIRSVEVLVIARRTQVMSTRYVRDVALPPREQGYRNIQTVDAAGLAEATVQQEVDRVAALVARGFGIAAQLGMEAEYRAAIRRLL